MVRPLCLMPHPMLCKPACRVESFDHELRQLVGDMIETMYAHDGVGLAAPQIGHHAQVFVANPSQVKGQELVMVNPLLERAAGRSAIVEGCLSVPKRWAKVRRAAHVRLSGWDLSGAPHTVEAEGLLAVVLQHELDHLRGRLFIDRLPWWRRARVTS